MTKSQHGDGTPEKPGRLTYTVREAAAILGVGAATLYRAITRQEVPFIKIGKRVVMPKIWVDGQLEKTA